jgi:hypothetical protein
MITTRCRQVLRGLSSWSGPVAFALISSSASAAIVVLGPLQGQPGDHVEFSVAVTAGTALQSIDIAPNYSRLAPVLALVDAQPMPALTSGGSGFCLNFRCSYTYVPAKSFAQDTVLETLQFTVTPNALEFVDKATSTVPLLLGINFTVGGKLTVLTNPSFKVLSIPEPSSAGLIAVGSLLLIVMLYRRVGPTLLEAAQPSDPRRSSRGES